MDPATKANYWIDPIGLAKGMAARGTRPEKSEVATHVIVAEAGEKREVALLTVDQPVTNEAFRKGRLHGEVSTAKEHTSQPRRVGKTEVKAVREELPAMGTVIEGAGSDHVDALQDVAKLDVHVRHRSTHAEVPRHSRHPTRQADPKLCVGRWCTATLHRRRFLRSLGYRCLAVVGIKRRPIRIRGPDSVGLVKHEQRDTYPANNQSCFHGECCLLVTER